VSEIFIAGTIASHPEIRYTRDGRAHTTFCLVVDRSRWPLTCEESDGDTRLDVVCSDDLAENVALSIEKGTRVIVTGRLEERTRETKTGKKRRTIQVVADDVGVSLRFATLEVASRCH
jgi:single-strand DNA-binding protein